MRLEMTGAVVLVRGVVWERGGSSSPCLSGPTPERRFVEAYYLHRARSRASPEREIRRAGVGEDGDANPRFAVATSQIDP
jgi:hypothetical protein